MKTITTIILFCLAIGSAQAARIDDVSVLQLKYEKDSFELKLQVKDGKKDSFFIVDIVKEDEKAFDKLALVLKKLKKKKSFKLNLDIPSFSAHPSGAYYKSDSVKFSGSPEAEVLVID